MIALWLATGVIAQPNNIAAVLDTIVTGDAASATVSLAPSLNETATTSDLATATITIADSVSDTATTGDSATAAIALFATLNESVATGDSATATISITDSVTDTITTGDLATASVSGGSTVNDTVSDIVATGDLATAVIIPPVQGVISGGAGNYNFLNRRKRKEEDDESETLVSRPSVEIVKIGKAPNATITGLVIPKGKEVRATGRNRLQEIEKSKFDTQKSRLDYLRAIQLADDDWMLLN